MERFYELAKSVGQTLYVKGLLFATAESCTGGWIATCITAVPGSSKWFDRGFVTYSNEAKQEMLGVLPHTIEANGAVSKAVVVEMAEGALRNSRADYSIAVSGIAGPDGGTQDKPVGTVWIAWAIKGELTQAKKYAFTGDREAVRAQTVEAALTQLNNQLFK